MQALSVEVGTPLLRIGALTVNSPLPPIHESVQPAAPAGRVPTAKPKAARLPEHPSTASIPRSHRRAWFPLDGWRSLTPVGLRTDAPKRIGTPFRPAASESTARLRDYRCFVRLSTELRLSPIRRSPMPSSSMRTPTIPCAPPFPAPGDGREFRKKVDRRGRGGYSR